VIPQNAQNRTLSKKIRGRLMWSRKGRKFLVPRGYPNRNCRN